MGTMIDSRETVTSDLSMSVFEALEKLISGREVQNYTLSIEPVSTTGENSYGQIVKVGVKPKKAHRVAQISFVLKLSPKNQARRKQMNVVDYYTREVFMYKSVLKEYANIQNECRIPPQVAFNSVPAMFHSSLAANDEFIIFEDLHNSGYSRFDRLKTLSFKHTALALRELAKFHAMSFVVKILKPELFEKFIRVIKRDNLFNDSLEEVSVQFAKKYIHRTIAMIEDEIDFANKQRIILQLEQIANAFNDICMKFVDGNKSKPYSVICHGDFWNNNILYKYDENGLPIAAKILDFQMSRHASPVLDFVHYIFTCTEKSLRDQHFEDLKRIYHSTLASHLKLFGLQPEEVYSYSVFEEHLRKFGFYGFCISIYAIPFIITQSCDIPDLDEVAEAVCLMNEESDREEESNGRISNTESSNRSDRASALIDEFEMLNETTIPIFRRRMIGIVSDLDKYNMLNFDL